MCLLHVISFNKIFLWKSCDLDCSCHKLRLTAAVSCKRKSVTFNKFHFPRRWKHRVVAGSLGSSFTEEAVEIVPELCTRWELLGPATSLFLHLTWLAQRTVALATPPMLQPTDLFLTVLHVGCSYQSREHTGLIRDTVKTTHKCKSSERELEVIQRSPGC